MATIKEVFQQTVKAELAKSNGTKWGAKESVAVILALIADETGGPDADPSGFDAEFVEAITKVVNPSAFAQSLESAELLKRVGRGEKVKSALMDFGK